MTLEHIGRYDIKGRLGRGGMATVYRGYDPRFGREVAVKVLPQDMVDDVQFRTRFEREARAIAALEHPCIVPVYDFAEDNGQPFIVMRLMRGGSLADRLKQGALSPVEASRVLERIAQALDAAHQRGIIHRDLKPGNILFDEYDNAYLSDFGIAHIVGAGSTLTGTGVIGTPAYMSPEQVQGGGTPLDARSDVYALGIILYQMLTGQTPFHADTPARVMMAHILEQPEPILDVRPDLPVGCEMIFEKALAKNPDERFDSAGELAAAFKSVLLAEAPTPQARPASPEYEAPTRVGHTPSPPTPPPPTPPPPPSPTPASPAPAPVPPPTAPQAERPRRGGIPGWVFALVGILFLGGLGAGGLLLKGLLSSGAASPTPGGSVSLAALQGTQTALALAPPSQPTASLLPSPSPTPEASPTPLASPTETPPPTDTPAPTPTPTLAPPVLGGADRMAFVRDNDIWTVNLDGSDLRQLTQDGGEKTLLQWMPDGLAVTYILGKCVHSVEDATGRDELIMCVKSIEKLSDFMISPDGSQVAVSIDNQLYVVPFNLEALAAVEYRTDLKEMGTCKTLSPYTRNAVKQARWGRDGTMLALKVLGNNGAGRQADLVDLVSIEGCPDPPPRRDQFPAQRFTIRTYNTTPVIQNFTWDGMYQFALTGFVRNDGFGDLYLYNSDLHKADLEVNPVDGVCCYRDPQFSPDGQYLAFAFQDIRAGSESSILLYYVDINTLGTGVKYTPINLPENFFSNPREKPQPILRPAGR